MKIGIDIGGSHIAIATINRSGQIVEKIEENIEAKEDISQYIVNYVDKGIEKLSKNAEKIEEMRWTSQWPADSRRALSCEKPPQKVWDIPFQKYPHMILLP